MVKVLYSECGSEGLGERAGYKYDYRGLCVYKTNERGVEYREYTADGRLIYVEKDGSVTDYVYNGSTIFAEVRAEGGREEVYYHHTNHLGTTEVISDEQGVVVWEANYEAFGSVLSENGTKAFAASFTGKLYDEDIGLYYFNARWYDSVSGRFITQDPARDGIAWYVYCKGNPVTYHDADGCIADAVWDGASLVTGAISFGYNLKHGNKKEALFDALGMLGDAAALALPFVPGGFGTTRKALKATKIAAEVVGATENIASGTNNIIDGVQNGDTLETVIGATQVVSGSLQLDNAAKNAEKLVKGGSEVVQGGTKAVENATEGTALTKKEINNLRRKAVKDAWAQEREMVAQNGYGTRRWTDAEINELLETGKVKGYEGHHINSVQYCVENGKTELIGNPDNINFMKREEHLKRGHGGNWKNNSTGELIDRNVSK